MEAGSSSGIHTFGAYISSGTGASFLTCVFVDIIHGCVCFVMYMAVPTNNCVE
jgi:hypothetical protein